MEDQRDYEEERWQEREVETEGQRQLREDRRQIKPGDTVHWTDPDTAERLTWTVAGIDSSRYEIEPGIYFPTLARLVRKAGPEGYGTAERWVAVEELEGA